MHKYLLEKILDRNDIPIQFHIYICEKNAQLIPKINFKINQLIKNSISNNWA
jgi:hypothetical protein